MTRTRLAAVLVLALLCPSTSGAERMGYPPAEFAARRDKLAEAVQRGLIVMFGATEGTPGVRFRQDNDFFYLTGNESLNGVLVIDAATKASHLFLPKLTPVQVRYEGGNWLDESDAAKAHAFASIQSIAALGEFLGRRRGVSGRPRQPETGLPDQPARSQRRAAPGVPAVPAGARAARRRHVAGEDLPGRALPVR